MYFHPLQEEITQLSDEEISKRIKELTKKIRPRNDITLLESLLGIHSQFSRLGYRSLVERERLEGFSELCDRFL